jgi:hypothetical protein
VNGWILARLVEQVPCSGVRFLAQIYLEIVWILVRFETTTLVGDFLFFPTTYEDLCKKLFTKQLSPKYGKEVVMKYRGNTGYLFYPILPCFGNIE